MLTNPTTRAKFNFRSSLIRIFNVLVILATMIGLTRQVPVRTATGSPGQAESLPQVYNIPSVNQVQIANFQASIMAAMRKSAGSLVGKVSFPNLAQLNGPFVEGSHELPPGTHVYSSDPGDCNNPSAPEMTVPYQTIVYGPFN